MLKRMPKVRKQFFVLVFVWFECLVLIEDELDVHFLSVEYEFFLVDQGGCKRLSTTCKATFETNL